MKKIVFETGPRADVILGSEQNFFQNLNLMCIELHSNLHSFSKNFFFHSSCIIFVTFSLSCSVDYRAMRLQIVKY